MISNHDNLELYIVPFFVISLILNKLISFRIKIFHKSIGLSLSKESLLIELI